MITCCKAIAHAHPPQILYISRDYSKEDTVTANRKLERRAEDLSRTLGFTHPYLTIESVSGSPEMWYLKGSTRKRGGQAHEGVSAEHEITGGSKRNYSTKGRT